MAGYAAGCHQGYRKGRREGGQESKREREVLVRAVRRAFELAPSAMSEIARRSGTDARAETFLIVKALAETERGEEADATRGSYSEGIGANLA